MAFVGRPSEVLIDSGRAKNARYARLLPSIRKSSRGVSPLPLGTPSMLVGARRSRGLRGRSLRPSGGRPPTHVTAVVRTPRRGLGERVPTAMLPTRLPGSAARPDALPTRAQPREPIPLRRAPTRASQRSTTMTETPSPEDRAPTEPETPET